VEFLLLKGFESIGFISIDLTTDLIGLVYESGNDKHGTLDSKDWLEESSQIIRWD